MPRLPRTLAFGLFAAAALAAGMAHAQGERAAQWSFRLDNDKWASGSDRHYTHGTRISRRSSDVPVWIRRAAAPLACMACTAAGEVTFSLGQEIYTPEETWRTELVTADRPYAGWSYAGAALRAARPTEHERRTAYNVIGVQVGIVGPASLAEEVQELIHAQKGVAMPAGWDHQLSNELGFVAMYERGFDRSFGRRARHAVGPYFAAVFGNVLTHAAGGVRLAAGSGSSGSRLVARSGGWQAFLELEARAVLRNLFLDGNTRGASHSVEREPFIGRAAAGLGYAYGAGRLRIALATETRSREFVGQSQPDRFTSLTFSLVP